MAVELPPLPYAYEALEPHISRETMTLHHDKHHQLYVTNVNKQIDDNAELQGKSLVEIVKLAGSDLAKYQPVMNQGGQALNHNLYWETMTPGGANVPSGDLAKLIDEAFGSFEDFKSQFKANANSVFGSGWGWLVLEDSGKLAIMKTPNGDNPYGVNKVPLLGIDMWEHAFYVDRRNVKAEYIDAFTDNLVNWDVVAQQLAAAR
ncbi:MAG: superoxide dismutase [Geminicoccaceae bacterium]